MPNILVPVDTEIDVDVNVKDFYAKAKENVKILFGNIKKISMSKCLKNKKTGNIIRVSDVQARQMEGSQWSYVSKTDWKSQERPAKKEIKSEEV